MQPEGSAECQKFHKKAWIEEIQTLKYPKNFMWQLAVLG